MSVRAVFPAWSSGNISNYYLIITYYFYLRVYLFTVKFPAALSPLLWKKAVNELLDEGVRVCAALVTHRVAGWTLHTSARESGSHSMRWACPAQPLWCWKQELLHPTQSVLCSPCSPVPVCLRAVQRAVLLSLTSKRHRLGHTHTNPRRCGQQTHMWVLGKSREVWIFAPKDTSGQQQR